MPATSSNVVPAPLQVPRQNRSCLAHPPLGQAARIARDVAGSVFGDDFTLAGRGLGELRQWTLSDTLEAASDYARRLELPTGNWNADGPVIVAGHQPSLFHCGVLLKNCTLARLAQHIGGVAINLNVDNDIATAWDLRVPTLSDETVSVERIPYAAHRAAQPWEELGTEASDAFAEFPDRVAAAMSGWQINPVLPALWPAARAAAAAGGGLADSLTAARTSLQDRWNGSTIELPVSRMAGRGPFCWFVAWLLLESERFAADHNGALAAYRQTHRVRSRNHPAADLGRQANWRETAFWCWRSGDTHRRRLLVRNRIDGCEISEGGQRQHQLPLVVGGEIDAAASALQELQRQGLRIRPSALTLTLFARVFLADLFVHGIGGAKYDEVTDGLISRFFGLAPPVYLATSGTLHLPLGRSQDAATEQRARLLGRLRQLRYNGQQLLSPECAPEVQQRKRDLIAAQRQDCCDHSQPSRNRKQERYQSFQAVNRALAEQTQTEQDCTLEALETLDRQQATNGVLADREYSFCLFPEPMLHEFLDEALAPLR